MMVRALLVGKVLARRTRTSGLAMAAALFSFVVGCSTSTGSVPREAGSYDASADSRSIDGAQRHDADAKAGLADATSKHDAQGGTRESGVDGGTDARLDALVPPPDGRMDAEVGDAGLGSYARCTDIDAGEAGDQGLVRASDASPKVTSAVPHGIYILDGASTLHRDGDIRALPYIAGYVWRRGWSGSEQDAGSYDFCDLQVIVPRLQALGQKLTILSVDEPAYIADNPRVETWAATSNGVPEPGAPPDGPSVHAVPWDPILKGRFLAFVRALSGYLVPDASQHGQLVPLSKHPVLANISLGVPGMGELRYTKAAATGPDAAVNAGLNGVKGYSRATLMGAVNDALTTTQGYFPDQAYYQGLWPITDNDDEPSVPLWQFLQEDIDTTFNGTSHTKVSLWMENLAYTRTDAGTYDAGVYIGYPPTSYATPECAAVGKCDAGADAGYPVSFQMLTGWAFYNPSVHYDASSDYWHVRETTPADAMKFAFNTYGSLYTEIYACDADSGQARKIDSIGCYRDAGMTNNMYRDALSNASTFEQWASFYEAGSATDACGH